MDFLVYREDFTTGKIKPWNVFSHGSFDRSLRELAEHGAFTEEEVRREAAYYFWSKSEYEIILSTWAARRQDMKVSVYDQIVMNWDLFFEVAARRYL